MSYFILKERISRNPYYNLSREEALALNLAGFNLKGGLRFWQNSNSIILGISDSVSANVNSSILTQFNERFSPSGYQSAKKANYTYIARRASGGGTVYQESKLNLNFSIFVNLDFKKELYPVKDSYEILLGIIRKALEIQEIKVFMAGKSDLSFQLNSESIVKVSGNAQFRKKNCIVHHGTLILDKRLIDLVTDKLNHPPEEPEYRKKRKHSEFISSLPRKFEQEKFMEDVKIEFLKYLEISKERNDLKDFYRKVSSESKRLFLEKYQNKDFIFQKP